MISRNFYKFNLQAIVYYNIRVKRTHLEVLLVLKRLLANTNLDVHRMVKANAEYCNVLVRLS